MDQLAQSSFAEMRAALKARNRLRYLGRYARNTPTPPGRKRTEIQHTLCPHFKAFSISKLAQDCWGWKLGVKRAPGKRR